MFSISKSSVGVPEIVIRRAFFAEWLSRENSACVIKNVTEIQNHGYLCYFHVECRDLMLLKGILEGGCVS